MGRPATLVEDCQALHAGLLQRGILPGQRIRRDVWAQLVARVMRNPKTGVGCSASQERNLTATGKLNGYWDTEAGHGPGNHGSVWLLAPRSSAPEPAEAAA